MSTYKSILVRAENDLGDIKLPEGMQGLEQGLVGESRSDSTKGHAEEAQPGERGVGEIEGAEELLGIIDRMVAEAQRDYLSSYYGDDYGGCRAANAKEAVLIEIRRELRETFSQRSDLSNA